MIFLYLQESTFIGVVMKAHTCDANILGTLTSKPLDINDVCSVKMNLLIFTAYDVSALEFVCSTGIRE